MLGTVAEFNVKLSVVANQQFQNLVEPNNG
jgi:hypothetical protein